MTGCNRLPTGPQGYRPSELTTDVNTAAPAWQLLGQVPVDREGWDRVRFSLTWPAGSALDWQACATSVDADPVPLVTGTGDITGAAAPVIDFAPGALLRVRLPVAGPAVPVRWSWWRHASWRGNVQE